MGEISGRPNSNTSLLVHSWKLFQLGAIPVCKMIRYSQSQKVGITATTLWLGFPYYPRLYLFLSLLCLLSGITPVGFAVSSVVSEGRFKLMCFVFFFSDREISHDSFRSAAFDFIHFICINVYINRYMLFPYSPKHVETLPQTKLFWFLFSFGRTKCRFVWGFFFL